MKRIAGVVAGMLICANALAQDLPNEAGAKSPQTQETAETAKVAEIVEVAKQLPVTDIELPRAPVASKAAKKTLSDKVAGILREKALRGTEVGIRIVDLDSGDIVYAHNDTQWLKPASNTKLVTTAAALSLLGADHQFESALLSKGKIQNGVLEGDLQLYIDHDFTWGVRFYDSGDVPLRGMIQQLKSAGVTRIKGKIIVSGYVVYGGEATGTLVPDAHLRRVGIVFGNLLRQNKITHNGIDVRQNAKPTGNPIATWKSPVLSEAIVPLNRSSHNEYADMLLLAIGSHVQGKSTYAAGASAVRSWLEKNGLPLKGFKMVDGSGLSHDNRMSAEFFTSLVKLILNHATFAREWAASLSISGYDGTYGGRLATDDAKGRVYAKSGTLRDTISSSGFFVNRIDGHTYAFSVIVNGMRNRKLTRIAEDRIVRVFLGGHLGINKPAAPEMTSFRKESDGRVMARWTAVNNALGYRAYQSEDGNKWRVVAETKDLALVMPDKPAHFRITAVTQNGSESDPSLIFSYRPGEKVMTIVEEAKCRSDADLRPANHFIAHERALASFVPSSWGVETVRKFEDGTALQGALYHSVACNGKITWDDELYAKTVNLPIPVMVDIVEAYRVPSAGHCTPDKGTILGCYGDPVVTMDRRMGNRPDNTRLRKAAGSASAKPSGIIAWAGSKPLLEMASSPVAVQKKSDSGGSVTLIGFDLQAVDSQKSLDAFWKKLME